VDTAVTVGATLAQASSRSRDAQNLLFSVRERLAIQKLYLL
jgi:hypothetical protein